MQRRISAAVYLIVREGQRKGRVVNVDRLAPYVARDDHLVTPAVVDGASPSDDTDSVDGFPSHTDNEQVTDSIGTLDLEKVHVCRDPSMQASPTTTRAPRQSRPPARYRD